MIITKIICMIIIVINICPIIITLIICVLLFPAKASSNVVSLSSGQNISELRHHPATPNLPTNIVPTNIARVKLSGKIPRKSPMYLRIPHLKIKIVFESKTLKSELFIGGPGVRHHPVTTFSRNR